MRIGCFLDRSSAIACSTDHKSKRLKLMNDFSSFSLLAIFFVSLACLLGAAECGHWVGFRSKGEANVTTLEAAILGLLALMISFTFSMALNRFEARREALLTEANSIGTAALRARMLPAPLNEQSMTLLREYTLLRIKPGAGEYAPYDNPEALARSNHLHAALWRLAETAAAKNNAVVPTGLYLQALNQVIDTQASRLTTLQNRVPPVVLAALYVIAFVALGFSGFASGTEKRTWRLPVYTTSALVAGVILLIQDIERPNAGFIRISQQPLIDAAKSIDDSLVDLNKERH
jgi:hypothetical protein